MPRKRKNQPTRTEGDKRQRKEADEFDSIEILPMTLQDEIAQPTAGTSTNRYVDFESILRESGALDNTITPSQVFSSDNVLEQMPETGLHRIRLGSDEVSVHVPDILAEKICTHQYINLALLLKGNIELDQICTSNVLHVNDKGQIESRAKLVNDKIMSIEKWTDAFLIFISVYIRRHPGKILDLLQYMAIIREAANRSPPSMTWRTYDEQFRLRQAASPQPWGKINADLWLRIMSTPGVQSNYLPSPAPSRGTCLDFNNSYCNWQNCKYVHACSFCGLSNHGRKTCFKLNKGVETLSFRPGPGQGGFPTRGRPARRGNQQ